MQHENHRLIIKWATDWLLSNHYSLQDTPQIILETPWSTVIRFSTSNGDIYLKETAESISLEPMIIQSLADKFQNSVPIVIAVNHQHYCFLMKSAGISLRTYLKDQFQLKLLYQAITQCSEIERSTEKNVDSFIALGVPDWRLNKFPKLYEQLINQTEFFKANNIKDQELQILQNLKQNIFEQCKLLSEYNIPETLTQNDFHTNNILIDPTSNKLTIIDWGEVVITHPFFSLHTFLFQATIHHDIKEYDQLYHQLEETCYEHWQNIMTHKQLSVAFKIAKKLWPIYSAFGAYRIMRADLKAFMLYYGNKPNRFSEYIRQYIVNNKF